MLWSLTEEILAGNITRESNELEIGAVDCFSDENDDLAEMIKLWAYLSTGPLAASSEEDYLTCATIRAFEVGIYEADKREKRTAPLNCNSHNFSAALLRTFPEALSSRQ